MRRAEVELSGGAAQLIAAQRADAPMVLCCEHASAALPERWSWPREDEWLRETHWAVDIGAATLTRELAAATGCPAVLATFSRLWADPNRAPDDPSLFLRQAEGRPVVLNRRLGAGEALRRMCSWRGYHAAVDEVAGAGSADVLLAVHSFTRCYRGERRDDLEVGVLFDREEALGGRLAEALAAEGFAVALNRPYSGRRGMIYSAHRHAERHGKRAVELEVRQDMIVDPAFRRRLTAVVRAARWRHGDPAARGGAAQSTHRSAPGS